MLQINTDEKFELTNKKIKLIRNKYKNRSEIASYIKNNNIKNKINSYKKNPRLMRMDIKNMKKCITPSSELLMKEFTKRYNQLIIINYILIIIDYQKIKKSFKYYIVSKYFSIFFSLFFILK